MKNVYLILSTFIFIACGGGEASQPTPSSQSLENTDLITSTFKLNLRDIPNYKSTDSIEKQYLTVLNYLRSLKIKCNDANAYQGPVQPSLQWNNALRDAAQEHSNDMLSVHSMTHLGSGTATDFTGQEFSPPRASQFNERILFNHYNYSSAGENIAYSAKYPVLEDTAWVQAMENWMKSTTGHCSNIMSPNFKEFGMAESRGENNLVFSDGVTRLAPAAYWTQNFGTLK